jgi:malic enzyme
VLASVRSAWPSPPCPEASTSCTTPDSTRERRLPKPNERRFYRTVVDHLTELLPIVYTPAVGEACQQFGLIFRRPRGLYVSTRDRGHIREVLRNWPERRVAVVVVTDVA